MIGTKITLKGCGLISYVSILVFSSPVRNGYNFPIAGNRTIAECVSGKRPEHWNEEMYITTTELARKLGYPAEEHVVLTEDGYILTLHRIKGADGARPVLLQHGLFGNSFYFVASGKNKAIALILVDKGYDVWLGNGRGSTYSMCHTHYTTSEYKYWNFSWHEMGAVDLPAEIMYITNATKQDVIVVGISMGTTISYVMAIERPDVASKVKAIFSLAPIAYLHYFRSPIKLFTPFVRIFEIFAKIIGGEVRSPSNGIIKYVCSLTLIKKKFCATLLFASVAGFDYHQFNYTILPTLLYHLTSASLKTLTHYAHNINSNRFQYYDYGRNGNLKMYNSIKPPDYDVSKINVPVGIFWSTNDYLADPKDVQRFYKQLPHKILNYKVKNPNFNHADFILAIDAPKYVFSKLLFVMENYK